MPVSYSNSASGNNGGSGTSVTVNLTVASGSNQACLAWVGLVSGGGAQVWDPVMVTCDGTRMPFIAYTDTATPAIVTGAVRAMGFIRTGLSAATHTFVASFNSGVSGYIILGVSSFFGVYQNYPVRQVKSTFATATSTSPSVTIPGVANDMTSDLVTDVPDVPGSPTQTQAWQSLGCASSYAALSGSSNTHGWTLSSSTLWYSCGACLVAVENAFGYGQAVPWVQ